ncbi:MAG: DUF4956 domain-containing protein [Chitinispirillaceae bacterium]
MKMLDFLTLQTSSANPAAATVLYTLLLAVALSILIGITYVKTFKGLSYSKNYVQALILSSTVAAVIMQAIGDSLARGLGMIGALAIIRFRTNFKDPRDIIFMFAALASGIACGVYSYSTGILGTLVFCSLAFLLYYSPVGQSNFFDGMLRFSVGHDSSNRHMIDTMLKKHCKLFALIALREISQGTRFDYSYQVKLRKKSAKASLMEELREVENIEGISLLLQETTIEL